MSCRVGITTDVARRKREWQNKYPGMYGWAVLARGLTRTAAQERENQEAKARGCISSGGGRDAGGSWSVYFFRY